MSLVLLLPHSTFEQNVWGEDPTTKTEVCIILQFFFFPVSININFSTLLQYVKSFKIFHRKRILMNAKKFENLRTNFVIEFYCDKCQPIPVKKPRVPSSEILQEYMVFTKYIINKA